MWETRLTRVETTLFGPTGQNGLVGNHKAQAKDLGDIKRDLRDMRLVLKVTYRTLRWASGLVLTVVLAAQSGKLGAVVAAMVDAVK